MKKNDRKHLGNRKKCFSKSIFHRVTETRNCLGNPFPMTNFRLFQTGRVCRLQFFLNLTKMAESSPQRVENTVGKGDMIQIAQYEQFLLFS